MRSGWRSAWNRLCTYRVFYLGAPDALASLLVEHAPAGINHVYFVSGGSEAVEAALKLARQYFVETGRPERRCVIARRQSYHGNTLAALAAVEMPGGDRLLTHFLSRQAILPPATPIARCGTERRNRRSPSVSPMSWKPKYSGWALNGHGLRRRTGCWRDAGRCSGG